MSEDKQTIISAMESGFKLGFRAGYLHGRDDALLQLPFDSTPPTSYLSSETQVSDYDRQERRSPQVET